MKLTNRQLKAMEFAQNPVKAPNGRFVIHNEIWLNTYLELERLGLGKVVECEYGMTRMIFEITSREESRFKSPEMSDRHAAGLRLALYRSKTDGHLEIPNVGWNSVYEDLEEMGFGTICPALYSNDGIRFITNAAAIEWMKVQPLDEHDKLVLMYASVPEFQEDPTEPNLSDEYPDNLRSAFYLSIMGYGDFNPSPNDNDLHYLVPSREGHTEARRLFEQKKLEEAIA